jgi:hypothetical protein
VYLLNLKKALKTEKIYNKNMIIFNYEISPAFHGPSLTEFDNVILRITIENTPANNVTIIRDGKKITSTLQESDINQIIELYSRNPRIFDIRQLEANDIADGNQFDFFFSDGIKSTRVVAFNIGQYGDIPHPDADLFIRIVKSVRTILDQNHIYTNN